MKENFDAAMAAVFKEEGGYVDNPHDPGGRTNRGVTQRAWEEFLGRDVTEQEMRDLTEEDVKDFYRKKYWDACKCDELPSGLDYAVFDFAVNSGPGRAAKTLQRLVHVPDDGKIGPATLKAVREEDAADLAKEYCETRLAFLQAVKNPKTGELLWTHFGKGWGRRVAEVSAMASRLA